MSTLIDALKGLLKQMDLSVVPCVVMYANKLSRIIAEHERSAEPHDAMALKEFTDYVVRNYPPQTFISDPNWHAPKLFRAAKYAIESSRQPLPKGPTE